MSNYTQFKLFLIISKSFLKIDCFFLIINLTKTTELNNLTQENILNLTPLWFTNVSAYINMDIVYFEINCRRNRLIYIITHIEVKNNKILFKSRDEVAVLWYLTMHDQKLTYICAFHTYAL